MQEHKVEITIIVFGSARIREPGISRTQLTDSLEASAQELSNEGLDRRAKISGKIAENSKYFMRRRGWFSLYSNDPIRGG